MRVTCVAMLLLLLLLLAIASAYDFDDPKAEHTGMGIEFANKGDEANSERPESILMETM